MRARAEREGWHPFFPSIGRGQVDAHGLVLDVPEVLTRPGSDTVAFRASMNAPAAAPGSRVLVVVDEGGGVALAGCPDPAMPGSCNEMVAGILAATGRLWHWPYEIFVGEFENYLGDPLEKYIARKAGEGWSPERFRSGVEKNLKRGHFPVMVVGAGTGEEATSAYTYLQSLNIRLRTVGFNLYESDGIELILPGGVTRARQRPEPRRQPPKVERPAAEPKPESPPAAEDERPAARPGTSQAVRDELEKRRHPESGGGDKGTKPGVQAGRRPAPGGRRK